MPVRFQWDVGNWPKCGKHGLDQAQIEAIFSRPRTYIGPDLGHSDVEERWIAVGEANQGRAIFVVFTVRQEEEGSLIRPLSARFMHAKEARQYVRDTSGG
jgi:uncharacterized DUF497 family protein